MSPRNFLRWQSAAVTTECLQDRVRSTLGDTTTAEQHYRTYLSIAERLAATDPDNAKYQRGLTASHSKLGDLAVALGDTTTAEQHYRTDLGIAERLAAADPGNAQYQRDLSISHDKLGNLSQADEKDPA